MEINSIFKKEVEKIVEHKKKQILSKLKENTPVDTGRARDGWHLSGYSIKNNVEYIDELNRGSSKQAPIRFIGKTVLSDSDIEPNGTIVIRAPT